MTLSEQLRAAAVKRGESTGAIVDDRLIDDNGVIDLRIPPEVTTDATSTKVLRETEGQQDTATSAIAEIRERLSGRRSHGWAHRLLRRSTPAEDPDEVIDLRTPLEPEVPALENRAVPVLGKPSPIPQSVETTEWARRQSHCPKCDSPGRRDHVDVFTKTVYRSCPSCFFMWQDHND